MKTIERLRELLNKPESIDRHAFNLSIVALGPALRAECEAWRAAASGRVLLDLYSDRTEPVRAARAATDAAGILKGGE